VIAEEFAIPGAERVLIFGPWAERYRGKPGAPPNDVDVIVIGSPSRAEVYDAADRAAERPGMPVTPVIRTSQQWAEDADPLIAQIKASEVVDVTAVERSP
jgi:hypothetical protein